MRAVSILAVMVLSLGVVACAAEAERPTKVAKSERVAIGPDSETIDATTIVGKPAPAWDVDWMGAAAITAADLRGQVVLVRWFTEGCPYCKATAPTLVAFHDELAGRGLRVIGMYHHKSDEPVDAARVRAFADGLGFRFPVAIDRDWKTLKRWWLDAHDGWTSVSFLIDRKGIVRYVHTGGSYDPGSADAAQMRRWIEELLAEPQR